MKRQLDFGDNDGVQVNIQVINGDSTLSFHVAADGMAVFDLDINTPEHRAAIKELAHLCHYALERYGERSLRVPAYIPGPLPLADVPDGQ
jgi:hypothetical protein